MGVFFNFLLSFLVILNGRMTLLTEEGVVVALEMTRW